MRFATDIALNSQLFKIYSKYFDILQFQHLSHYVRLLYIFIFYILFIFQETSTIVSMVTEIKYANTTARVDFHDGERVEMVYNVKVSCQDK